MDEENSRGAEQGAFYRCLRLLFHEYRVKGCWWHIELNIEKFDRRSIIVSSVHGVVKFDRIAWRLKREGERGLINHHPLCVFSNAVKNSFHAYFETK